MTLDISDLSRHASESLVNFIKEGRELLILLLHKLVEHLCILVILTFFVVESLLFHHSLQDVVLIQLECLHELLCLLLDVQFRLNILFQPLAKEIETSGSVGWSITILLESSSELALHLSFLDLA